ncbi:MAG: PfkB family carbohydrate kinase [Bryobacteraceae bacterium]
MGYSTLRQALVPVSTVGAGDTALAGLLWALEASKSWEESLRFAVAASASAVTKPGTEAPSREEVLTYLDHVQVHGHVSGVTRESQTQEGVSLGSPSESRRKPAHATAAVPQAAAG